MPNSTFRFWLRTDKQLKDGTAPIFLIYQISGQRKYLNTGIKLRLENWDNEHQQAICLDKRTAKRLLPDVDYDLLPLSKEIDNINDELDAIVSDLKDIEKRFELDKMRYGASMVVDAYNELHLPQTKKDQSSSLVPQYIDRFIEEQKSSKSTNSLKIYRGLKNHLADYAKDTHKKVAFAEMDKSFFAHFQNYLIEQKNLRNTTVAKQLSTLKTILNYADSCSLEVNMNYKKFTIKREPLPVIALTQAEFSKLFFFDFSDYMQKENRTRTDGSIEKVSFETLDKARDLFCFACVTGLRYSDLSTLRKDNIKNDAINITVIKTKHQLHIPLNEYATTILEKYKGKSTPLPRMTNQRMNEYLKVVGRLAGIDDNVEIVRFKGAERIVENYPKYELIGVHTGRKTFCTLSLEKGMSAEQVMAISGHTDYKSFKRYVHVTNENKKQAILKAWTMPKVLSIAK